MIAKNHCHYIVYFSLEFDILTGPHYSSQNLNYYNERE